MYKDCSDLQVNRFIYVLLISFKHDHVMHNSVCSSVERIILTDGNMKIQCSFEMHTLAYFIVGGCEFQYRYNCKFSEILLATECPPPPQSKPLSDVDLSIHAKANANNVFARH
jgi:hypothetical protein